MIIINTLLQNKIPRATGESAIVYVRPEDEYFHKQAAWSCTFAVTNRAVGKDELRPLRLVMLVDSSKVCQIARLAVSTLLSSFSWA